MVATSDLTQPFKHYGGGGFDGTSLMSVLSDLTSRVEDVRRVATEGRLESDGDDTRQDVSETLRLYRLQHHTANLLAEATALHTLVKAVVSLETFTRGRAARRA